MISLVSGLRNSGNHAVSSEMKVSSARKRLTLGNCSFRQNKLKLDYVRIRRCDVIGMIVTCTLDP